MGSNPTLSAISVFAGVAGITFRKARPDYRPGMGENGHRSIGLAGGAMLALAAPAAQAATGSLQIRMEIPTSCTARKDRGWIDVNCTERTPYEIRRMELSASSGEPGTPGPVRMVITY